LAREILLGDTMTDGAKRWHVDPLELLEELQGSLRKEIDAVKARTYKLEGPFLKEQVVPKLHSFLTVHGYSPDQAKKMLLAEGCGTKELKHLVSGTPASKPRYPFKKGISKALEGAQDEWWKAQKGLYASCPDFALRAPHKIVFEGKLFTGGSLKAAKSCLVHGIYECAFYRGLPTLLVSEDGDATGYDFGCLFVYDASPMHSVSDALRDVNKEVRQSWWTELKVFMMVVPDGLQ
jgi:hypothetical protein